MIGDRYVEVTATVGAVRDESVRLIRGKIEVWIPRSLIHGADEYQLADAHPGDEITLRIFQWKAQQSGLLLAVDNRQGTLL